MLVLFSLGCGGCCLSLLQFVFASGNEIADRILRTLHCVFVVVCVCVSVCTVHVARIVFLVIVFALIVIAVVIMIVVIFRIVVLVDGSTSAFGCGGGCHHSCGLESTCASIFFFVLVQCKGLYIHIRLQMLMNRVR